MNSDAGQSLRTESAGSGVPIRPPWALPEDQFNRKCTQCGECVQVCPEKILVKGASGYPEVTFNSRGCTFCGKCVVACHDNALYRTRGARPWSLSVAISANCLSVQGVTCQVCAVVCTVKAIQIRSHSPDSAWPVVETAICTGCGSCVNPCPVQAITVARL